MRVSTAISKEMYVMHVFSLCTCNLEKHMGVCSLDDKVNMTQYVLETMPVKVLCLKLSHCTVFVL